MTNLTENQKAAMTALIKSCLYNMGGSDLSHLQEDPCTWVDASDLVAAGWDQKQAEGTFGSLCACDLICEDEMNQGQMLYALTSDWDELAKYHA